VADVIDRRVADGEKIGSGGFAEIQGVDGFSASSVRAVSALGLDAHCS